MKIQDIDAMMLISISGNHELRAGEVRQTSRGMGLTYPALGRIAGPIWRTVTS